VTAASLAIASAVGLYLGRANFTGRRLLLSVLTLPLSFPGVIVGFFVILMGGRQGPFASLSDTLFGERITFAYGITGLFIGYLYFSLPRAVATFTAVVEGFDPELEAAARSLGAGAWQVATDVWLPALLPTALAIGAIVFSTSMGAFGTAFTLASRYEVLPITIYNEFTNYANFALAASLSITLGLVTWASLFVARVFGAAAQAGSAA
jgi:putative spermidine/putrescine transport system permease protein